MARNVKRFTSRRSSHRSKKVKQDATGYLCSLFQLCYRIDIKFDKTTIKLTGIDLYDPDATDEDEIWKSVPPPYSAAADKAATAALKRAAQDGEYDIDLCQEGCECRLSEKWTKWSGWVVTEITGGFSLPAPKPPPAKLRYRAKGTIKVKTRLMPGGCYKIEA